MYGCGRSSGFSDGDMLKFNALALLPSGQCKDQWVYSSWHSVGCPDNWPHGWPGFAPLTSMSLPLWPFNTNNKPDGPLAYFLCFSVEQVCVLFFLLFFIRLLGQILCWHHTLENQSPLVWWDNIESITRYFNTGKWLEIVHSGSNTGHLVLATQDEQLCLHMGTWQNGTKASSVWTH